MSEDLLETGDLAWSDAQSAGVSLVDDATFDVGPTWDDDEEEDWGDWGDDYDDDQSDLAYE